MRRENYMIGLMASGVLDLGLPVARAWSALGAHMRAALADGGMLITSLLSIVNFKDSYFAR